MRSGDPYRDACRSGGTGLGTQDGPGGCAEIWKDQELEDASTKAASELCKGQGLHLYGPSLGIRSSLVAWQSMIQHCHCCVLGHWCGARSIPGPRTKTNKQKRKKESMKAGEK